MGDRIIPVDERVRLVELVDRVLDRGVVLRGDVTISVAGVDLVYLELHLLLTAVENIIRNRDGEE
jgi:gas vesicle structural protein